ncbi:MAG TPA: DUF4908 domain-containing protein [Rhizomicrobium sp.]|jgi:hypothetical protein|nr:DUF4908 domain-containing protein [Rhizomicrobium sp.]
MARVVSGLLASVPLLLGMPLAHAAPPAESFQSRLSSDRVGQIESGTYLAGDKIGFALDAAGPDFLLSFDASPEIFVLHADTASLGGRVLKYDSGDTALQVSGWGGVTLYTDSNPGGLPAVRTGSHATPAAPTVSIAELENAAQAAAEQLAFVRRLDLAFSADWRRLAGNAAARAVALDAIGNVARGIEQFGESARAHAAVARVVKTVALAIADRPTVTLRDTTLTVTFDPDRGFEGRASSRAIARALHVLLSAAQRQSRKIPFAGASG